MVTRSGIVFCRYQLWKSTFDASIYLIQAILSKLRGTAEDFFRLLKQVIDLVLLCARKVEIFESQYDVQEEISRVISPAFHEVSDYLTEYIDNALGRPFGKGIMRWSSSRAESEIKVAILFVALDAVTYPGDA